MIHGKDIVVVGLQPWDIEIGSNCKNIAVEFSKHNRVLYVNPPVDRLTSIREKDSARMQKRKRIRKGEEQPLVQVGENIWNYFPKKIVESVNGLPDGALFDFFNRRNGKRFSQEIRSVLAGLEFRDIILFNDNSIYLGYYLKELLQPSFSIYYIRDFLIKNPYWKKHAVRLEPQLIRTADLVVTNSALYASYAAQFNRHAYMVGQGCDISAFDDTDDRIVVATELKDIPRPIIGYTGFLSSRRLDMALLEHLSRVRPSYSIVLVGPEDEAFKKSALHERSNIFFLGHKDVSEMPGFIKGFDVAINPQSVNDATSGNYPRKVDEYLALGKAVVARATPAMDYFADVTYLGNTFDEYVELIDTAIAEDSVELASKRKDIAQSHSWTANVNNIYQNISRVLQPGQ
ncbi:MAG: glycosyl transferase family 1 [Citrobacter freundii]|nr:MAG: glycosyl transferase family 1 [Citrobacter freundii]